jgi:hypothetical protein|tara:strand:- start:468 stop:626 length:159 start_codon:yes stop_codon:yes gene_type:complete
VAKLVLPFKVPSSYPLNLAIVPPSAPDEPDVPEEPDVPDEPDEPDVPLEAAW